MDVDALVLSFVCFFGFTDGRFFLRVFFFVVLAFAVAFLSFSVDFVFVSFPLSFSSNVTFFVFDVFLCSFSFSFLFSFYFIFLFLFCFHFRLCFRFRSVGGRLSFIFALVLSVFGFKLEIPT